MFPAYVIFETGSCDWINITSESGYSKNPSQATHFENEKDAMAVIKSKRYSWLKDTLIIQEI